MSFGKLVFSQVIDNLPQHIFRQCMKRYRGNHKIKTFTCLDQFQAMAFAQIIESLGLILDKKINT